MIVSKAISRDRRDPRAELAERRSGDCRSAGCRDRARDPAAGHRPPRPRRLAPTPDRSYSTSIPEHQTSQDSRLRICGTSGLSPLRVEMGTWSSRTNAMKQTGHILTDPAAPSRPPVHCTLLPYDLVQSLQSCSKMENLFEGLSLICKHAGSRLACLLFISSASMRNWLRGATAPVGTFGR